MEWVSYLAGERHSSTPECVSEELRILFISLNDNLLDEERQKLRPYLTRTIGTAGDGLAGERLTTMYYRLCLTRRLYPYAKGASTPGELGWYLTRPPRGIGARPPLEPIFALLDELLPLEPIQFPARWRVAEEFAQAESF
jgi:hypothetical protein